MDENILNELSEAIQELDILLKVFENIPNSDKITESLCKISNAISNVIDYEEYEKHFIEGED